MLQFFFDRDLDTLELLNMLVLNMPQIMSSEILSSEHTFLQVTRVRPQPSKLFIFSRYLGLKVAYCLAQQFDQLTYACEEYNNYKNSKSIFMISNFKVFPIMLLRQRKNLTKEKHDQKGKTPLFFSLQFLLFLSEKGLSPERCLAICHPRASYLSTCCFYQMCMPGFIIY